MKADELRHRLVQLKVPESAYSLGRDRDESYCLILENGLWRVFYSERGNRVGERAFSDNREAAEELLHRLLSDELVRRSMASASEH
jgi:hypothetical protein